jgi:hypothetical protein
MENVIVITSEQMSLLVDSLVHGKNNEVAFRVKDKPPLILKVESMRVGEVI